MKTIGLIGGTSWVSTVDYYRIINQTVNEKLAGLNSAKIFLYSVNFEEFKKRMDENKLDESAKELISIAKKLETAGADCLLLCANTPHMFAELVQSNIKIPLIHIAEETAREISKHKIKKVALLGTKFTMEQTFFKEKLLTHGIETIIPAAADRDFIHKSIFSELGKGIFTTETKNKYLEIIKKMENEGAEGIIFGCTEIPLLIKQEDCKTIIFDTAIIHAKAAVEFATS